MDTVNLQQNSNPESNEIFTFQHPLPQQFPFQDPIIKYIFKNVTPKAWKKLIQTCKYFYSKNPIYPIQNLKSIEDGKWEAENNEIFNSNNLQDGRKLWIYNSVVALRDHQIPNLISSLIPKICKCELGVLEFDGQNLSLKEYQILTSSGTVEWLALFDVQIKYSDGTWVTFDKLLENFKNMRSITLGRRLSNSNMFEPDTVKNMVTILSKFTKLRYLHFSSLTETFDFASFINFLLENQYARIMLGFHHNAQLSNAYREMIRNFIDRITANPPQKVPRINF